MTFINELKQFIPGTKALASEVNQNFETLRQSNNNQNERINILEEGVDNMLEKSGGNLLGSLHFAPPETISSVEGILTLHKNTNSFEVTGQETITEINGWNNGIAILRWTTSRTIQHNSDLSLQNSSNRATTAGDTGIYEFKDGKVREIAYFPKYTEKTNNFKSATVLNCPVDAQGYADFIEKIQFSQDIIPIMTSNTHTDCTISASSEYNASYQAYNACNDNNLNTLSWLTPAGMPSGWLKINFTEPKKASALSITSRNNTDANIISAKTFIIEASNDDENYIFLGSWANITGWVQNEKRIFAFQNQNHFKYYRLTITENNGGTYVGIGEFELFEAMNEIEPLIAKISAPVILNFAKGYSFNGKINETGYVQQNVLLSDLPDNTLLYLYAEKLPTGDISIFKTTASPSYVNSKQKHSEICSVPKMLSNTTSIEFSSGYSVLASSFSAAATSAFCAFDKKPLSKWMAAVVGGNQFIQIDLPNKRKAARFTIKAPGDLPDGCIKNGVIKGWDGSSWINLKTISEQTNWIAYEKRFFDTEIFAECSKFKLEIDEIQNPARNAQIAEFEIYELGCCFVIPDNRFYIFNPEENVYTEKKWFFWAKSAQATDL